MYTFLLILLVLMFVSNIIVSKGYLPPALLTTGLPLEFTERCGGGGGGGGGGNAPPGPPPGDGGGGGPPPGDGDGGDGEDTAVEGELDEDGDGAEFIRKHFKKRGNQYNVPFTPSVAAAITKGAFSKARFCGLVSKMPKDMPVQSACPKNKPKCKRVCTAYKKKSSLRQINSNVANKHFRSNSA